MARRLARLTLPQRLHHLASKAIPLLIFQLGATAAPPRHVWQPSHCAAKGVQLLPFARHFSR